MFGAVMAIKMKIKMTKGVGVGICVLSFTQLGVCATDTFVQGTAGARTILIWNLVVL